MSHEPHAPVPGERKHFFDSPENTRMFFRVFYVACALLVVAELIFGKPTEHPHPWERVFGFYALWGFASFWFLVLVAKQVRKLLIRPEDYYEAGRDGD